MLFVVLFVALVVLFAVRSVVLPVEFSVVLPVVLLVVLPVAASWWVRIVGGRVSGHAWGRTWPCVCLSPPGCCP